MVILNSPSNPTGAVYTPDEIRAITAVAVKHGIYLLSDEMYEYLLYDDAVHLSPASISEEARALTLTASEFSNTFSMTGWRLGTLMGPPAVAKAVGSIQSGSSTSKRSQWWPAVASATMPACG